MTVPHTLPYPAPAAAAVAPPSPASRAAGRGRPWEAAFVWGVFAAMLLAVLAFVDRFGSATLFGDDWGLTPVLAGDQSPSLGWFWEQHNEHRIALPRLVMLGLYRLTGNDLRAPMFFDVGLLAVAAAVLVLAARAVRGRSRYTDAFFPLVLLHWGHGENLLWSFQVAFVLPAALLLVVFAVVVRGCDLRGRTGAGLVAGACLLGIAVSGVVGVIWPPVLTAWVLLAVWPMLRSADRVERRTGALLLVLPAAALVVAGLYFVGYERPSYHPPPPGLPAVAATTAQALSMMFGRPLGRLWPVGGLAAVVLLAVAAAPPLLTLSRAVRGAGLARSPETPRATGILLCLAAVGLLALSIGWGRAGLGWGAGMAYRYVTIMAPALCALYFAWLLFGAERWRNAAGVVCFAGAVAALPIVQLTGLTFGRARRAPIARFERDLRAGVPATELVERHWSAIGAPPHTTPVDEGHERAVRHLLVMRRAGISYFRELNPGPALPPNQPRTP